MNSTRAILRTGFYTIWRPGDGCFYNKSEIFEEEQYKSFDCVSTILHLDEALECFRMKRLTGKQFDEFSVLESLEMKVIRFSSTSWADETDNLFDNTNCQTDDQSIDGSVKLLIDTEHIFRTNSKKMPNIYFVEVVDANNHSIVRIFVSFKDYMIFPKLDLYVKGSPIYKDKNKLYLLKSHDNFNGRKVKYDIEILVEDDGSDLCNFWDVSFISTINHEGQKRFRCKRVLNRSYSVCLQISKEDTLCGVLCWMLLHDRMDIYSKFLEPIKKRLCAVNWKLLSEHPRNASVSQSDNELELSISDIEDECERSIKESNAHKDTALNSVCDFIAHGFYFSKSTVDVISLQQTLQTCETNETFPTVNEIKACLVLLLKWMRDPELLHTEVDRRQILLSLIPCENFLTSKYQLLSPCTDGTCAHEKYLKCTEVKRRCYGYVLFACKRWMNEDNECE